MEIKLVKENEESLDAVLSVNIKLEDIEEEATIKLKTQKQKVNLPGFRPGKVPLGIAKKYLWEGIVKEELENHLEKSINEYFKENDIEYIRPLMPIQADKQINLLNDKDFGFSYDIGLVNKLEIDTNKILGKITRYNITETDGDVQKEIELMQDAYGTMDYPEKISDMPGLTIYFELTELDDDLTKLNEGISKLLSKKYSELPEKLKELFDGKEKGEFNIEIDKVIGNKEEFVALTGIEKLEAEDAGNNFSVEIKSIHTHVKAEVNEDFYNKATQGQAKNKEEFDKYVRELIQSGNKGKTEHLLTDEISEELVKSAKIDLPEKFISRLFEEEKKEQTKDMTDEEKLKEKEKFQESIKFSLIVKHFVDKFEIKTDEREIVEEAYYYIRNFYMQYGIQKNEEEMKEEVSNFLKKVDNISYLQNRIENRKVFDKLIAETEFKSKDLSLEEFNKIHDKKHKHHDHD